MIFNMGSKRGNQSSWCAPTFWSHRSVVIWKLGWYHLISPVIGKGLLWCWLLSVWRATPLQPWSLSLSIYLYPSLSLSLPVSISLPPSLCLGTCSSSGSTFFLVGCRAVERSGVGGGWLPVHVWCGNRDHAYALQSLPGRLRAASCKGNMFIAASLGLLCFLVLLVPIICTLHSLTAEEQ